MNTSALSHLSPVAHKAPAPPALPPAEPDPPEPHEVFQPSLGGAALLGLGLLSVAGGAQAAQAQVQTASNQTEVGKVKGLLLPKGKVDADGTIRNVFSWPVARVKVDGSITGPMGIVPKGHVDDQGRVYAWGGFFPSGRVDTDGTIRNNFGVKVGQVQGQDPQRLEQVEKGGAALLLLLQDND